MSVLTFVIVGQQDHPIYEVDLTGPKEVRNSTHPKPSLLCHRVFHTRTDVDTMPSNNLIKTSLSLPDIQQQAQYLHQFVLHASLDAVDETMWGTKELHLKVRRMIQYQTTTCSTS